MRMGTTVFLGVCLLASAGCDEFDLHDDSEPFDTVTAFEEVDLDDDGVIVDDEWLAAADSWDIDEDGFLEADEFGFDDGFDALDLDDDLLLSEAESDAGFDAWDLDDDGFLDEDELDPYFF